MPVPSLPDPSTIDPNNSKQVVDVLAKIKKEMEWLVQNLDGVNIAANAITANHIQAGAIQAGHIQAGTIQSQHIQSGSITSDKIAANAITSQHIQSGSIETSHISTDGLDASVVKTGTMLADRIRGGVLTLGGYNNQYGKFYILDPNNNVLVESNPNGLRVLWVGAISVQEECAVSELWATQTDGTPIQGPIRLYGRFETPTNELGYCGVSGVGNGGTGPIAGTGVNFRVRKTYTPSSVTLSAISNNVTPYVLDITSDGFWLYLNGDGTTDYKYWRGYYIA